MDPAWGSDRLDVWTKRGECFEGEFHSFESEILVLSEKWYTQSHHRGEGLRGDRLEYRLDELLAVDAQIGQRDAKTWQTLGTVTLFALATFAAFAAAFAAGFGS